MASGLFADDEFDLPEGVEDEIDAAAPAVPLEVTPRSNPDLLGHEDVEKMLLADFNAGRMPHAIILAGEPGTGKATLAFRLARFLLAQGDGDAGLFGESAPAQSLYISPENPVFRRVASGAHPDLFTLEREFDEKKGRLKNDISVDSVRAVQPSMRRTASEGGWRVLVIDGAEYLNGNSQNALLKLLEEPPQKTLLVLTTSQPGGFLPTIRSRCRMVQMKPLADTVVSQLLDRLCPGLSAAQKAPLMRLAEGSIGRALQFHKDDAVTLYQEMLGIFAGLPELDILTLHDLAEKTGKYGAEKTHETAREILTGWCLRLARAEARGEALADVLPGDADKLRRVMAAYPSRHFLSAWERAAEVFAQGEQFNLDKKQVLVNAFIAVQDPQWQGLNLQG